MPIKSETKKIEINGIELKVNLTYNIEAVSEECVGDSEIEINSIRYSSRDVTDIFRAFDLMDKIKDVVWWKRMIG